MTQPDLLMQELITDLQYTYDRVRYYDEKLSKEALIAKIEAWKRDANLIYNNMDSSDLSDLEDENAELTEENRDLRSQLQTEVAKNGKLEDELTEVVGEKRKKIDQLTHDLNQERDDALLLQSSILAVLGKDKLDLVLGYAKALDNELNTTGPKDGIQ
jgi:DNA anti-recombination protein RmuC